MAATVFDIPRSALVLGLLGLVPFALCAAGAIAPLPGLPTDRAVLFLTIYAGLILCFLGGIRWGAVLGPYGARRQARDFAASILPLPVVFWAVFQPATVSLGVFIAAYLLMALWDVLSAERGQLPLWFGRLRMILTTGAVLSLLVTLTVVLT